MQKKWLAVLAVVLFAAMASPATATVIYDNGGPSGELAYWSDRTNNGYQAADLFTLSSGATIWDVHWWGIYAFGNTPPAGGDVFSATILADTGSGPGALIGALSLGSITRTDTFTTDSASGGMEIYRYDVDLTSGFSLPTGSYFLSIENFAVNPDNAWAWEASNSTSGNGHSYWHPPDGSGWIAYDASLAFNLTGTPSSGVPEPATLALLGIGVAGLAAIRRRRK